MTEEGLESNLAVNYLGNFLLTTQLLPLLKESPDGRVMCVNSSLHKKVRSSSLALTSGVTGCVWDNGNVAVMSQFVWYHGAPVGRVNLRDESGLCDKRYKGAGEGDQYVVLVVPGSGESGESLLLAITVEKYGFKSCSGFRVVNEAMCACCNSPSSTFSSLCPKSPIPLPAC